jgi:hypothetical protein
MVRMEPLPALRRVVVTSSSQHGNVGIAPRIVVGTTEGVR